MRARDKRKVKTGPIIGTPRLSNIQKKRFIEAHHRAAVGGEMRTIVASRSGFGHEPNG